MREFRTGTLAAVAAAVLALTGSTALAQDSTAASTVQPVKLTTPQLSYGVSEVVKLAQAKASEETILAYVKNSGNSYGLDADQIIYLQQQGVSSPVITAMLNQPKMGTLPPMPAGAPSSYVPQPTSAAPAPQPDNSTVVSQSPPSVTYVQSAPADPYYYSDPGYYSSGYYPYYPYYSYPYYGYGYPLIGFGFGYGYGFRGGYGFHGGYGYHGGGGFHGGGGGFHGGGGGGFHGGGGGGHR